MALRCFCLQAVFKQCSAHAIGVRASHCCAGGLFLRGGDLSVVEVVVAMSGYVSDDEVDWGGSTCCESSAHGDEDSSDGEASSLASPRAGASYIW